MNKKLLKTTFWLTLYGLMAVKFLQAQNPDTSSWEIVYEESFTDVEEGEIPEDFFILDGDFEVITKDNNKCLKLSWEPVGEHGFLYGPRQSFNSFEVSFSCLGAMKSRRHNGFASSLGGIRGHIFRINPASKELSLHYGETSICDVSLPSWSLSDWMNVHFRITGSGKKSKCEILISNQDDFDNTEMATELLIEDELKHGRFALWGFAYAEQDIYWDNLIIRVPNLSNGVK